MGTIAPQPPAVGEQQADGAVAMEYNDSEYCREVLLLDPGVTEAIYDDTLAQDAEALGITTLRPATPAKKDQNVAHTSMSESTITMRSHHARTLSSGSQDSDSTGMTSRSSTEQFDPGRIPVRRRTIPKRSLSFSEYTKYLILAEEQDTALRGFVPPPIPTEPAPSLFSVSTRRSMKSIKSIRKRIQKRMIFRRDNSSHNDLNSCICCRDIFKKSTALHTLPCGHSYCEACLRVLITQSANEESKMPPRCCTQPIPSSTIKSVLCKEDQYIFIKSVLQFSTPWEARIFCPNPECGEFIPKRNKIDPKHPFEVVCRKCRTRVCSTCKRNAHKFGQDCPSDTELDAILKLGEKSGWRRCYKCRHLVELTQGCSHMTCRCKAQFCYICGAIWDPLVGCPNFCNGEEELERRRLEEEARNAELEAEKAAREEAEQLEVAEQADAERRTEQNSELQLLKAKQINERDRFRAFERKMKWVMWTRHGQAKLDTLDRYEELATKMKERHARTANHLEDRQVGAEMELRATLRQAERSVQIRLRHMEAYCDGLGRHPHSGNSPRVVTERDLRELGQQYNVRDDLARLHQSKINVMRDKQTKQMELLIGRQEVELAKLATKQGDELVNLEESFVSEEERLIIVFDERRDRLRRRFEVVEKITRKKLEAELGVRFAAMKPPDWPDQDSQRDETLEAVSE